MKKDLIKIATLNNTYYVEGDYKKTKEQFHKFIDGVHTTRILTFKNAGENVEVFESRGIDPKEYRLNGNEVEEITIHLNKVESIALLNKYNENY